MESRSKEMLRLEPGQRRFLGSVLMQLLEPLLVWTRRRMPARARRRMDSGDVVQEAVLGALQHDAELSGKHPRVVEAYVKRSIQNRIRDELRRVDKWEIPLEATLEATDSAETPLDSAISSENSERFWSAVERLKPDERLLLRGRVGAGESYLSLATRLGRSSADAARVATRRALLRVARLLKRD